MARLWIEITEHHAPLDPIFRMREGDAADAELIRLLEALLGDPDAAVWVHAEPGGARLDGICIARVDRAPPITVETLRGEISDLGVSGPWRRRGIGRGLARSALGWLRERGVARAEVRVASGNHEGQAFWRALGFGELMDVLHLRLEEHPSEEP